MTQSRCPKCNATESAHRYNCLSAGCPLPFWYDAEHPWKAFFRRVARSLWR